MNKIIISLAAISLIAFASAVAWEPVELIPQPEFERKAFLLTDITEEMNVDFAIFWTDSAASFFVYPFDAVILHTEVEGEPRDIFVISDPATDRLMVWMCTAAEGSGERELLTISACYGSEEYGEFESPSGLATNAINREFKPDQDVIYVADRGNNRIVELRYFPNEEGGEFVFNRILGEGYLEWPVDVAISAYGDQDLYTADLYVVDWGHVPGAGELVRISILNGEVEGSWHDVLYPQSTLVLAELNKPVSVACFPYAPDSSGYFTAIYITEEVNNPIYLFKAQTDDDPEWCDVNMLENGDFIRQPGGLALDDFGRIYIANQAAGMIEMYGPNMRQRFESYGTLGLEEGQLYYPSNLILDTFYDECEALVFEHYGRKSGLQTYFVAEGISSIKPPLGFDGAGLPKIAMDPSTAALPLKYYLGNAYPNPFNSSTSISFALPQQSDVKIVIYNILGQKTATLFEGLLPAGNHTVTWDASDVASGVYYYKLSAGDYTAVKMMTLLK